MVYNFTSTELGGPEGSTRLKRKNKSAAEVRDQSAANKLKNTPQKRPIVLPTKTRRLSGTTVKHRSDTNGQSFQPAVTKGQTS
jgi:hypothetical protein